MDFLLQTTELLEGGVTSQRKFFQEEQTEFLHSMVREIENDNPQVRDELNYRLLVDLIQYRVLSDEQTLVIVQELLNRNSLLHSIGNKNDTTVFTRALAADWYRLLLTEDQMVGEIGKRVLQDAIKLLHNEQDLRAYTENGLAYSVGNSALLIYVLLDAAVDANEYAAAVLTAIQSNFWKINVFTDDEEERLIALIQLLLNKGCAEEILIEWIEQIFERLELISQVEGFTPKLLKSRTQILNFMKSLYFDLKFKNKNPKLQSIISIFIQKWNRL